MGTVLEQIEATRVGSDQWSNYERAALLVLNRHGVTDLATVLTVVAEMSDKDRRTVWLADSMVWTIREIRRGGFAYRGAFRGMLQMATYAGHLGGFWPCTTMRDGYSNMSNFLQDLLSK